MNRLFFTRCAKVGSEAMLQFLEQLQHVNNFSIDRLGLELRSKGRLPIIDQHDTAHHLYNSEPGTVYIEHLFWIDFKRFNLPKPIYINLVRDPVERVISWYYYVRNAYRNAIFYSRYPNAPINPTSWYKMSYNNCVYKGENECQYVPYSVTDTVHNFKSQAIFFCGHYKDCLPFNSPLAVQMAKRRVEQEFAVVGTWEETNITLAVLEHYIPRYFAHARSVYATHQASLRNRNRNNRKPAVDARIKAMVRRNFTHEIDFYYFCRQRLYKQYIALQRAQLID